jgi:hypothetical protein
MSLGTERMPIKETDSELVKEIKTKTAELIDLCNNNCVLDPIPDTEMNRCYHEAMQYYELGGMWAVRAAVTP